MGGPNFNTHNMSEYFTKRPYLDYFIVNQGETGFLNFINNLVENKLDRNASVENKMDNVAFYNTNLKRVIIGDISKRYKDLDIILPQFLTEH